MDLFSNKTLCDYTSALFLTFPHRSCGTRAKPLSRRFTTYFLPFFLSTSVRR